MTSLKFVFLRVTAQDSPFLCFLLLTLPTVSRLPQVNVCVCVCVINPSIKIEQIRKSKKRKLPILTNTCIRIYYVSGLLFQMPSLQLLVWGFSLGLRIHSTEQRSEILSASFSVDDVSFVCSFSLAYCVNKKTRHVDTRTN